MAFTDYFDQFIRDQNLNNRSVFCVGDLYSWFDKKHPEVKRHNILPQLLKKTTNHPDRLTPGKYNPNASTIDDFFYAIDSPVFRQFQLYQRDWHEPPYYPDCLVRERELQNLFAKDPSKIEVGLKLVGVEYPSGGRHIDLLCLDTNEDYVVVELKLSLAYDQAIGQLVRYMGWIKKHRAKSDQKVRGIIVASKISEDLKLAVSMVPNVRWLEYSI